MPVQFLAEGVTFGPMALSRLMPLHLAVGPDGAIVSAGATFLKVASPRTGAVIGRPLAEVLAPRRAEAALTPEWLAARPDQAQALVLAADPSIGFRALAVPVQGGGVFLNLTFGIGVADAVRRHNLTVEDFAATDLTVEMLYLVEAKTAVMDELRDLNQRLHGAKLAAEAQALTDPLTGLRNRRALELQLDTLVSQRQPFGLMHVDLDYFKQVNDTLGHAAGDHVLRVVAGILTEETRASDVAARVGGDEFLLVFPGLTEAARLLRIARRIIARLTQPTDFEGRTCRISASIGVTLSTYYDPPDIERMLADADGALYASKRAGRGRAQLVPPPDPALSA